MSSRCREVKKDQNSEINYVSLLSWVAASHSVKSYQTQVFKKLNIQIGGYPENHSREGVVGDIHLTIESIIFYIEFKSFLYLTKHSNSKAYIYIQLKKLKDQFICQP